MGSVPGQPNYTRPSANFEFVPRDGWHDIYPTLKVWAQRTPESVMPSDEWTKEEAPCMAKGDKSLTARHFKLFYPQFAGYECCLRKVEEYEVTHNMRYKHLIKTRPDATVDSALLIPSELRTAASIGEKRVVGAPYFHRHMMCDLVMMATREAAEALFTVHHGLVHCDTLTVGGEQCCGGAVNQKNFKRPSYCKTLAIKNFDNTTECMVDRWLRHNGVIVRNTLVVPGNVKLLRWRVGDGAGNFRKTFKELDMMTLKKYDRFSDWRFRDCTPEGFSGPWPRGHTPTSWPVRRLLNNELMSEH